MAIGTIRFAIIIALVAVGAVLIAQFPDASTATSASGGGTPAQTESPSPGGTAGTGANGQNNGATETQPEPSPEVKGVKVAVYNGTLQTGLAAAAAADLVDRYGYKINQDTSILDAENKPIERTTVYYASAGDKLEATALATSYFKGMDVKVARLPDGSQPPPEGVRVAVYLGNDYAETH